jgi:GxxExxY protein
MRLSRPEDPLTDRIIAIAIGIHQKLGPGLYESVYESILAKKLRAAGFKVDRQKPVPLIFEGEHYDITFRADLIVNDTVLLEIKAVEEILKVHTKQVITYLKLTDLRVGLLLNFNTAIMSHGIYRFLNDPPTRAPDEEIDLSR